VARAQRRLRAAGGTALSPAEGTATPPSEDPASVERLPPRRVVLFLSVAVAVAVADVISKVVVVATLQDRDPVVLLGGYLRLIETRNPGAAFSIGGDATLLFTFVALVVVVVVSVAARRLRYRPWALALGLLLGGAIGNLVDRLLRDPGPFRGAVVDWIDVPHWPTFNLADCGIVVGGLLAALLSLQGRDLSGQVGRD
jgi:lipoprotein signal peptidase